ncbi:hypothetical protein K438DRAFT_1773036 [Mycena galopus ATCC 62051]|nr:hypothetical protein K438DRAFT_1773036 [Mycena galopus ATCC 62051]
MAKDNPPKIEAYLAASKAKKTKTFYQGLFKQYWAKFHWSLPLKQEPSPTDVYPTDDALTPAQEVQKAETQTKMKQKIKTWYNHRCTAMGMTSNVYLPFLAQLRRPEGKPPKRLPDFQFYMQHADFKDAVNNAFEAGSADVPKNKKLAYRCDLARSMLAAEPDEVRARIRKEAEEEHAEDLAGWEEADEGFPAMEPEGQAEYVVSRGRRVDDGKLDLRSLHVGKTRDRDEDEDGGQDFTEWDSAGYKDHVLNQFMRYLIAADKEAVVDPNGATGGTDPAAPITLPDVPPVPIQPRSEPAGPDALQDVEQQPTSPLVPPPPTTTIPQKTGSVDDVLTNGPPDRPNPRMLEELLEDRMQVLLILVPELRAEIMSLVPSEWEPRIVQLERMDKSAELARIKAAGGGAPPGATTTSKAPSRKCKRLRGPAKPRKRGGRRRASIEVEEDEETSEESDEGLEDSGDENQPRDPPQTRGRQAKSTPPPIPDVADDVEGDATMALEDAPKWAKNARATLIGADSNPGAQDTVWKKSVGVWWDLERSTNFASPIKGLGTTKRPEEIQIWIKCARATTPKLKDIDRFVEEWQEWWKTLNPEWRTMCDEVSDGLIRDEEASLEGLRKPGANGFLSVLIGLKWWRDAQGAMREWVAALDDVTWVMGRLLKRGLEEWAGSGNNEGGTPPPVGVIAFFGRSAVFPRIFLILVRFLCGDRGLRWRKFQSPTAFRNTCEAVLWLCANRLDITHYGPGPWPQFNWLF